MEVPDDLKADSGLKTYVRDAIRPHLEFIKFNLEAGMSEAATYRYLVKHGHKVGSRSGFGAALKYLLKEEQSAGTLNAPADRSSPTAIPTPPHSATAASFVDAGSAEGPGPAGRLSINTAFAEHRFQPTFGGH